MVRILGLEMPNSHNFHLFKQRLLGWCSLYSNLLDVLSKARAEFLFTAAEGWEDQPPSAMRRQVENHCI